MTVGITYHDEGPLLTQCLESLLAGPEGPDEILVYDDASRRGPDDFIPRASGAKIIRGAVNVGPSAGRNRILRETSSDYVHFHDADDLFRPSWGARVRESLERDRPDAVFCECAFYDRGRLTAERVMGLRRLLEDGDLVRFCIRHCILVPAGVYAVGILRAIGGYSESIRLSEDFEFHLRLAAHGIKYSVLDEPLIDVRHRSESRSRDLVGRWADVVLAIELLAPTLPPGYRSDLAERAAEAASSLYKLGAREAASRGFALARALGEPTYTGQPWVYRLLARRFGPQFAERTASTYRLLTPVTVRRAVRAGPWR